MEQKRDPAGFKVRTITAADAHFLGVMLREAAAGPSERPRASLEELLADPQTARYVENWGRAGDTGRIAESPEGTALGAAWYRQYSAAQPGYGFVSESVPEVSMAVDEQARGAGLGTALLTALVDEAHRQGHPALSLSVLHENPAVRLYERLGFRLVEVVGESQTMRLDL
ncbi:MAG: GNAT family N-acetyltransferase [Solirubrobacteraceae bacterium]